MNWARGIMLRAYQTSYTRIARPVLFRSSAQQAHAHMLRLLSWLDAHPWAIGILRAAHRAAFTRRDVTAGGVTLPQPLILAAGFVKGHGFASEDDALTAVARGENIIPGWRCIPPLAGPVEFGSFTRWPRLGNPGTVLWRDPGTHSTQNRVGLKNPGAQAAAVFLARHADDLPDVFGINIAVSPGVDDPQQQEDEVLDAIGAFVERRVLPAWFTLNISCPNTEDDPGGHQTEDATRQLCGAVIERLAACAPDGGPIPLWVKVGPTLADEQYRVLLRVFGEVGVRAVVATNTLPEPSPGDPGLPAGVGGGRLHARAVEVVRLLAHERARLGSGVDLIGCGGVEDGATFTDFTGLGAAAVQYWSALVYRGPLAAALIGRESVRQANVARKAGG